MRAGGIWSSSKSGKRSEGGPGEGVGLRQGLSIQAWTSKRVGFLRKLVKVTRNSRFVLSCWGSMR
eukprot:scaffold8461_cov68-Phaeocystis_antarctica.AAC.2